MFEAQSTALIQRPGPPDPSLVINNNGTFRKTGVGTTNSFGNTFGAIFNNTGTLEVLSGTLNFNNYSTFNNNGIVRVQGGLLRL